jgi:hypothetical protein
MTCRSAGVTVESLRRIAKERVRLKARVGDIRAGNIAISAPRDARTEDGARLSKFPYGLDAPLPPPPSAQNLGQVQRDEVGFGLGHGQQKTPTGGTSRLGGLGLPNNRHAVVGDNASDVHPLYRGSLENQREGHSLSNRAHPHTNVNIHKVTPGRRSPNPAGHGYEYAYPDDKNFLHDWHPNLSPLHEDSQLPSHQQVHEDRITSSPSPSHSQPQPRAISPAEITEHRDLIERLHRFGIASSSSPTPSSTSQKPVQKPLPASLENLRLEEGPAEKRTDPETPRTAVFSLRRREAERIAQARYMRSFSPTQRSNQGGTGHSGDEGVRGEGGLGTRKLRHRSSDTDLTGSLYSRFSRHRQGPIQRDLGRDLRYRREWKWEWELDEDRNVDFDRNHDLEEGEVVLPRVAGIETEDTLGRGSLAQSTWEADLLSSYTTSTSAPPVPSVPPAVPPHSPTIFPHERGPAPAPMVCTNEHTHIMPGPSPGALRRVAGENSRVKGDNVERQKVRLGLMTGTVEEGGRGWV